LLNVERVTPALPEGERGLRRGDHDHGALRELRKVDPGMAGRESELKIASFLIVETQLRIVAGTNECGPADLDLRRPVRSRIEDITWCEGGIELGRGPIRSPLPPERHFTVEVAHPRRRSAGLLLRRRRTRRFPRCRRDRLGARSPPEILRTHHDHRQHRRDDPRGSHYFTPWHPFLKRLLSLFSRGVTRARPQAHAYAWASARTAPKGHRSNRTRSRGERSASRCRSGLS